MMSKKWIAIAVSVLTPALVFADRYDTYDEEGAMSSSGGGGGVAFGVLIFLAISGFAYWMLFSLARESLENYDEIPTIKNAEQKSASKLEIGSIIVFLVWSALLSAPIWIVMKKTNIDLRAEWSLVVYFWAMAAIFFAATAKAFRKPKAPLITIVLLVFLVPIIGVAWRVEIKKETAFEARLEKEREALAGRPRVSFSPVDYDPFATKAEEKPRETYTQQPLSQDHGSVYLDLSHEKDTPAKTEESKKPTCEYKAVMTDEDIALCRLKR